MSRIHFTKSSVARIFKKIVSIPPYLLGLQVGTSQQTEVSTQHPKFCEKILNPPSDSGAQ